MTFTYNLASSNEHVLNISKVRLELGDTVANVGVRPDGSNLTDEEIDVWLGTEENHIMHTVIRACDALARMWSTVANITVGPRAEDLGKVSDDWSKRVKDLSEQYGSAGGGSAFGVASARVDGYSENADSSGL